MSEEKYRIGKLIIMAGLAFGIFSIGNKIAESLRVMSENGRYLQHDRMKDVVTTGSSMQGYLTQVIDTRTGAVKTSVHQ